MDTEIQSTVLKTGIVKQEWLVAKDPKEAISRNADAIVEIYLNKKPALEATGMGQAMEFSAKKKILDTIEISDIEPDLALEIVLTDPEKRLNQKDIQFLKALEDFLDELEGDKREVIQESILTASEKLAASIGVSEEAIAENTRHAKEVVGNIKMLGGDRLTQLLAVGHDGVKIMPSGMPDLTGHEAKSAMFNASVGRWLEGDLVNLGFVGEVVAGATEKFMKLSYTHRSKEFPEENATWKTMEIGTTRGTMTVEVGLLWGTKTVRLPEPEYVATQTEVGSEDTTWVESKTNLHQTGDIATGLSGTSLEKYHGAYAIRSKQFEEILATDDGYYDHTFKSFISNIRGALDPKAMEQYMATTEFKHSLVIRRMMRLGGGWRGDEVLKSLGDESAGVFYSQLVSYREEQRKFLEDANNDTDENRKAYAKQQKEKFRVFREAVKGLSEEELDRIAAAERAQLAQDMKADTELQSRLK